MSSALNIGTLALNATLSALQVIGHNIANANTAGYSRQTVEMRSSGYQTLGGNFYGMGVELGTVARQHDVYLTREAQIASSVASADSERLARLQQLENLFPTGEAGLGAAMNDMLNAWSDVSSSPGNLTARVVTIARAEDFASRLRNTAGTLDALAANTQQQVNGTVTSINNMAKELATINKRLTDASLRAQGFWLHQHG